VIVTALLQGASAPNVVGVLTLLIQIALVLWTYTDAQKNSSHPAFLWAFVVFLSSVLGIIAYLILGRNA
jgi:hypothetical protein